VRCHSAPPTFKREKTLRRVALSVRPQTPTHKTSRLQLFPQIKAQHSYLNLIDRHLSLNSLGIQKIVDIKEAQNPDQYSKVEVVQAADYKKKLIEYSNLDNKSIVLIIGLKKPKTSHCHFAVIKIKKNNNTVNIIFINSVFQVDINFRLKLVTADVCKELNRKNLSFNFFESKKEFYINQKGQKKIQQQQFDTWQCGIFALINAFAIAQNSESQDLITNATQINTSKKRSFKH